MISTVNEALELARDGKWNEAWHVAQKDDGLIEGVTFEQWKAWALDCLNRRS